MRHFFVMTSGQPTLLFTAETEAQVQEAVTATCSTYTEIPRLPNDWPKGREYTHLHSLAFRNLLLGYQADRIQADALSLPHGTAFGIGDPTKQTAYATHLENHIRLLAEGVRSKARVAANPVSAAYINIQRLLEAIAQEALSGIKEGTDEKA